MSWTSALAQRVTSVRRRLNVTYCAMKVHARWALRGLIRPTRKDDRIVVTLTSYPRRFSVIGLTLKALLTQSVRPHAVVLWIAEADRAEIPASITQLEADGLRIMFCDDLRSYKKIIPAIAAFPGRVLVTADDDVYYTRDWLDLLITTWDGSSSHITCHRAREFAVQAGDKVEPYSAWKPSSETTPPDRIFPVGVGGVLYPPGAFASEVGDRETFSRLCPYGDDIWLYWMARRAGSRYSRVNRRWAEVGWPDAQASALHNENVGGGRNDVQIAAMLRAYGMPSAPSV